MLYHQDLVAAVREMMDRHWDIYEIAAKIKIDPITVANIVNIITDQLT
jgi:hypothetical protein